MARNLGTFALGEVPRDLVHQYRNDDGTAIDLSSYSTFNYKFWDPYHADTTVAAAAEDLPNGEVKVTRTAAMSNQTGPWRARFIAEDGSYVLDSDLLVWTIA